MRHEIFGGNLPAVTIFMEPGERIFTQSGGMTWMTEGIAMETNTKGGLMKGLARMFAGESLFMATYTATRSGDAITCASSFPGNIVPLTLSPGREYICQKQAFLCAEDGVSLKTELIKGMSGLLGGEGFILQRLSGQGSAFIELDGSCQELVLEPGQRIKVNTGNVAIYESSVSYSVETVKGFKNILFGGEGLFLTVLEGPGRVWLQTMTMPSFASRLIPYLPKPSNNS